MFFLAVMEIEAFFRRKQKTQNLNRKEESFMPVKTKTLPRILSLALAAAMMLTMLVSAFAADITPNNVDTTKLNGVISQNLQTYSATVSGPSNTTKYQ